jgi:hypothetical protein
MQRPDWPVVARNLLLRPVGRAPARPRDRQSNITVRKGHKGHKDWRYPPDFCLRVLCDLSLLWILCILSAILRMSRSSSLPAEEEPSAIGFAFAQPE